MGREGLLGEAGIWRRCGYRCQQRLAGRLEEARKPVARALELDPKMRISNLKERMGAFPRPEDYAKYAEGLRIAGLPE